MPLKITQILRACTPRQMDGSDYVQIRSVKSGVFKKTNTRIVKCKTLSIATPDGTPKKKRKVYTTVVYGVTPPDKKTGKYFKLADSHVKISCNCDDFWSHWEWALWIRGAADIIYTNGKPPDVKNPTYRPGMCKHLIKVCKTILQRNY